MLDTRKELGLLKEVQDILDEIKMIQAVIDDQIKVLKSLELRLFFGTSFGQKERYALLWTFEDIA